MMSENVAPSSSAESAVLKQDKGSAVMEPLQSEAAYVCKSSCEVTAEGDRIQHPPQTQSPQETLVLEKAAPGSTAEAEVAETVTEPSVVEAAADRSESTASQVNMQHSAFICAVVFTVLQDFGAIGPNADPKEQWETTIERMMIQAMKGLKLPEKLNLSKALIKKVRKAVVKHMEKKFGRAHLVSAIPMRDAAVEKAMIKSIRVHAAEIAPQHEKKGLLWFLKGALQGLIFVTTFVLIFALLALII